MGDSIFALFLLAGANLRLVLREGHGNGDICKGEGVIYPRVRFSDRNNPLDWMKK